MWLPGRGDEERLAAVLDQGRGGSGRGGTLRSGVWADRTSVRVRVGQPHRWVVDAGAPGHRPFRRTPAPRRDLPCATVRRRRNRLPTGAVPLQQLALVPGKVRTSDDHTLRSHRNSTDETGCWSSSTARWHIPAKSIS